MAVGNRVRSLRSSLIAFIKAVPVAAFAVLPSTAHAEGSGGTIIVVKLEVLSGSGVYISATGIGNPDGCASSAVVKLPSTSEGELNRMMSLVTTAKVSGKHIELWLSGCSGAPWYASVPLVADVGLVD